MGPTEVWTFQEIAFKAEMNRHEDPEADGEAFVLCGEDSATTARNIVELRNMIYERGECHPHRLDDAYLLRFLRARRSVPARAHRLLVRYCNFRDQNPHLWRDIDWFGLTKLGHVFEGVLFDRPDVGRLIIGRLGLWDPDEYPVDDLIRGCLLLLEIGIMQPKLQILGGTALLDCQGLTMKHMRQFSPAIAIQAMNVMGFAFPTHQRGVHVVNCSRVFETLFHFFKRLAPVDDLWKRVHFHGNDLSSLHKYIDPECLPKRYGGQRDSVALATWLTKIKQYKNKDFDDEMRNLGYCLVRYCNFRDQNPHLWRDIDWFGLTKLGHVFEGVLFDRPDVGRLIIGRLGLWDPDEYPVDDLIRGCLLLLEIGIMQPKLQILGGTALLDCQGLTMKHMRQFSPAIAIQAMNVMGFAFPTHQRGVHVVNCSRVFETLFHFFKRLAPVDDLWKRVHFHGNDLSSLHKYIDPECLPKRYGGQRDSVALATWLTKIKQYKNKDFDDEMRNLGYCVD